MKFSAVMVYFCIHFVTCVSESKASNSISTDNNCTDGHVKNRSSDRYNSSCLKLKCIKINGTYLIEVISCPKPEPPPNTTQCQIYTEKNNASFPWCCPKLRCKVRRSDDTHNFVYVKGQSYVRISDEHTEVPENLRNQDQTVEEDVNYPLMSAEETDYDEDYEEEEHGSPIAGALGELPKDVQERLGLARNRESLFDWIIWPVEVIALSETEMLRIFKTRDENLYMTTSYQKFKIN